MVGMDAQGMGNLERVKKRWVGSSRRETEKCCGLMLGGCICDYIYPGADGSRMVEKMKPRRLSHHSRRRSADYASSPARATLTITYKPCATLDSGSDPYQSNLVL